MELEEQQLEEGAPNCPPLIWVEAYLNSPWWTPFLILEWVAPYQIFMPKHKGCTLDLLLVVTCQDWSSVQ